MKMHCDRNDFRNDFRNNYIGKETALSCMNSNAAGEAGQRQFFLLNIQLHAVL